MLDSLSLYTAFIDIVTLSSLEIILGIDNLIFITIIIQDLSDKKRPTIRLLGLISSFMIRLTILSSCAPILSSEHILISVNQLNLSTKSCLFILGGTFLTLKSVMDLLEMCNKAANRSSNTPETSAHPSKIHYNKIFAQIVFISIILSFDSVIAGFSLSRNIYVILSSITISMGFVILLSEKIARFTYKYSAFRVIALLFMVLLGIYLILSAFDMQFPKIYLYAVLTFATIAELINIKINKLRILNNK